MKYNICSTLTSVLGRFFSRIRIRIFSGSDPDFWSIRILTQKKSLIRIREKKLGSETLVKRTFIIFYNLNLYTPQSKLSVKFAKEIKKMF